MCGHAAEASTYPHSCHEAQQTEEACAWRCIEILVAWVPDPALDAGPTPASLPVCMLGGCRPRLEEVEAHHDHAHVQIEHASLDTDFGPPFATLCLHVFAMRCAMRCVCTKHPADRTQCVLRKGFRKCCCPRCVNTSGEQSACWRSSAWIYTVHACACLSLPVWCHADTVTFEDKCKCSYQALWLLGSFMSAPSSGKSLGEPGL